MADEIVWINHAGYELRTSGLRIVHDPWLFGRVFAEGWSLIAESSFTPADFAGVDYIWFSHEHPDHFSPAVLKQIPLEIRQTITVLFQATCDKRVVAFCEKLGFSTLELPHQVRTQLNKDVAVTCGVTGNDSWLFTETPDQAIFNANDCVGVDWLQIANSLPRPVDTLLTQFSFANWVGNPEDSHRAKAAAIEKLSEMQSQIDAFKPEKLIPFASYVWFCRQENYHMNTHANRVETIATTFSAATDVVILYPGDVYNVGKTWNNSAAIERYTADLSKHNTPLDVLDPSKSMESLIELSRNEQERLKCNNWLWMLRPLTWIGIISPIKIFLTDLDEGIEYSMFGGILHRGQRKSDCNIGCTSASFEAMLKNGYGYSTLVISGRYSEITPGATARLSKHFAVAARNEEGYSIPGALMKRGYLSQHFRQFIKIRA